LASRFNVLGVCSEADRRYLGGSERIHVIPNGFDLPPHKTRTLTDPARIGFIGTLKHAPNLDGLEWFMAKVWPLILERNPKVRLRLVGAGTDGPVGRNARNTDGLGWLSDPGDEIATWSLMVVPVRMGGGTRVKIAEGFGRNCPVVSTTLGAFGYEVEDGREIFLADRPIEFADACLRVLADPNLGASVAQAAWRKYTENWTWEAIRPRVGRAVEHCLRLSRRSGAAPVGSAEPIGSSCS
jgi:glycosyltransferase involved in cell wall biosynthesis